MVYRFGCTVGMVFTLAEFAKLAGAHGTLCTHDSVSFLSTARHEARWV
jgi:hypothetical protein